MDVVMADDADLAYWAQRSKRPPRVMVMSPPPGLEDCDGCSAVGTIDEADRVNVHVAWSPSADDLERLNNGGLLWLTCVGGLMPHSIEVAPPTAGLSACLDVHT